MSSLASAPETFRYVRASTLPDITAALRDALVPVAGGTVLVPNLSAGSLDAPGLVDIRRASTLHAINVQNSALELGATTTIADLVGSGEVRAACPVLWEAAQSIGNPNVRRVGTVGGNVALHLPTCDLIPALLVSDARVDWISADGDGSSALAQLISQGLIPHSAITRIRISTADGASSGFVKFGWRRASAKTIVSVAARLECAQGTVKDLRLSVAGFGATAVRLPQTENRALGQPWTDATIGILADSAANEPLAQVAVQSSASSPSEWYRRRLVRAGVAGLLTRIGKRANC